MMMRESSVPARLLLWVLRQGADKALIYSMLSKGASAVFGLLTILAAGILLRPDQQGYLAAFLSLASTYMLVELGLGSTIIQFASHESEAMESAAAQVDRDAARSRLYSIGALGLRWFGIGALIYAVVGGIGGLLYFQGEEAAEHVTAPWLFLCFIVSIDIVMMPLWFLLEGVNEVLEVYRYRAMRMALLGMGTIAAMALGGGVWSLGVGYMLTLPLSFLVIWNRRDFFRPLARRNTGPEIDWSREMLPYQGRLVVGTICSYLVVWLPSLIALKLFGPVVAGQIAITWSAMSAVSILCGAALSVKIPIMGKYVAARRFEELDHAAWEATKVSMSVAALVAAGVVVFVAVIDYLHLSFSHRILPLGIILPAMVACTMVQFLQPMQVYLRAFKRDPFVWVSISIAVVGTVGIPVGGAYWGAAGFVAGYIGSAAVFSLPLGFFIFLRKRKEWRFSAVAPVSDSDLVVREK